MNDRLNAAAGYDVPRETIDRLNAYVALLNEGSMGQNLVSKSTLSDVWERHIVDSAQLVRLGSPDGDWADIGSGAGLPGLVIAILTKAPITLVEPRRLRAEFLQQAVQTLDLGPQVTVIHGKTTSLTTTFAKITARAVAPIAELFDLTRHLSRPDTVWILPKGRTAQKELDEARLTWQGEFRLEPSLTDPDASILLATGVRRRAR